MAASDLEHLHQLAVHAYYVGEHEVGRRACERLLAEPLPPERETLVRRNRTWYTRRLDELVPCSHSRIDIEPAHPGWTLFNPSLASRDGDLDVIVRSSNYRCIDGRYVMPPEDQGRIRTESFLLRWDDVREPRRIVGDYPRSAFVVDGLEDCRLNVIDGRLRISATVRNYAGFDGLARIVEADDAGVVQRMLPEPRPGRHEKNWMPILGRDEYLYSCHESGRVLTVAAVGDRWAILVRGPSPLLARGFRGGSQLVPVDGGWLAVVHEVSDDEGRRTYEHRFVWFDADFAIVGVSPPFAFREPRTIEFAAGLAVVGERVLCSYGVRDEEAWIVSLGYGDLVKHRRSA